MKIVPIDKYLCKKNFISTEVSFYKDVEYCCDIGVYKNTVLGIFHVRDNDSNESTFFYEEDFYKHFYSKQELRKVKIEKINDRKI